MSLIINLIVGLIAFYFAYMYATRKPMLVKVPWYEGWKYECNQPLSFLIYSILTAMLFLGPLSLVKYGVWIVILLLMMYRGLSDIVLIWYLEHIPCLCYGIFIQ